MAQGRLYDEYVERLVRKASAYISGGLKRRYDGQDIVQAVFASLFAAGNGHFRLASRNELWRLLVGMTTNKAHAFARHHLQDKRTVADEVSINISVSGSVIGIAPEAVVRDPSPEEILCLEEILKGELAALSDNQRSAVKLHLTNQNADEIANEMGASLRSVQRWIKDFKNNLQGKLADHS